MLRFILVVLAILFAVDAFVGITWDVFTHTHHFLLEQAVMDGLALAFVSATIVGFRHAGRPVRLVYGVSATWLGGLNFAFFAANACWLTLLLAKILGAPLPHAWGRAIFSAAAAATLCGLLNARWLRRTDVTVRLRNLPEAWHGRVAVLVTDLHLGHLSGPAFLRKVLRRIRAVQPDVVFISGDLFDGTTAGIAELVAPWKEFSAPWGIYYVTGNHDEFAERAIYLDAVKATGINVIQNEKILLHGMQVVGVHDGEAGDPDVLKRILRDAQLDPGVASILLAHQPTHLPLAEAAGVSLQLSGHTHRGQLWPWNLLVRRIYGPFAYGLQRLGGLQVITSSGAGTWGPPLRLGTISEFVRIRFEPEVGSVVSTREECVRPES